MGRSRRSAFVPWLGSDSQAKVLAALFLSPEPLHIRAVADRAGVSYSVAQREIDRLEASGLVSSQRFGRSRVVRPNKEHPQHEMLTQLLLSTYGPREVLAELLSSVSGLQDAYVFGSWAARYDGQEGSLPQDVDVLLIGEPDPRVVDELSAEAEERIGQPVQITVVSPEAWKSGTSGFVRTVKKRPLVRISSEDR